VGGLYRKGSMANPTGAYLALKKLWHQLPDTMRTDCDRNQVGDPLLKKIIELCDLYRGDYAGASGRLTMLRGAGALKGRKCDDGWVEITKAEFPEPANPADWVEKANEDIRHRVAEEQAKLAYEAKVAKEHLEFLSPSGETVKRQDFQFLMQENGLDPESLAATVEAAVEKVRVSGQFVGESHLGRGMTVRLQQR
jgi:hypothetical protein